MTIYTTLKPCHKSHTPCINLKRPRIAHTRASYSVSSQDGFSLALTPLARYQMSPPHLSIRSAAEVGPSTAGLTSRKNTGSPVGSGGPE